MAKCYYIATRLKKPGSLYKVRFTIKPDDAINHLDAGVTEIVGVTKEVCQQLYDGWEAAGYEMVSELRLYLGLEKN